MSLKQKSLWLIAAMIAPMVQIVGKVDGLTACVATGIGIAVYLIVEWIWTKPLQNGKLLCAFQLVWLILVLSVLLKWTGNIWPTGRSFPFIPLALLLLATISGCNGTVSSARVNAIVFFGIVVLIGVVTLAGTDEIELDRLTTELDYLPVALFVMLLPVIGVLLPVKDSNGSRRTILVIGLLFVVLSVWTTGVMFSGYLNENLWPFYEASKSISLFGRAKRFEALVSVAVTFGYFSLFNLISCVIGNLGGKIVKGGEKTAVLVAGAGSALSLLIRWKIPFIYMVFGMLMIMGFLPFAAYFMKLQKKMKKEEKKA